MGGWWSTNMQTTGIGRGGGVCPARLARKRLLKGNRTGDRPVCLPLLSFSVLHPGRLAIHRSEGRRGVVDGHPHTRRGVTLEADKLHALHALLWELHARQPGQPAHPTQHTQAFSRSVRNGWSFSWWCRAVEGSPQGNSASDCFGRFAAAPLGDAAASNPRCVSEMLMMVSLVPSKLRRVSPCSKVPG